MKDTLEVVGEFEALPTFGDETHEVLPVHFDVLLPCFDGGVIVVILGFQLVGNGHNVLEAFFKCGDIRLNGFLLLKCGFDGREIGAKLITERKRDGHA